MCLRDLIHALRENIAVLDDDASKRPASSFNVRQGQRNRVADEIDSYTSLLLNKTLVISNHGWSLRRATSSISSVKCRRLDCESRACSRMIGF